MRNLLLNLTLAAALATPLAAQSAQAAEASEPAPPAPAAAAAYKYATPQLNRAELDALLARPEALLIIDVRRPDEVTAIGGLPVFLSVQAKDLENSLAFIPKERTIVTVSNHAGRAGAAGDFLASRGFRVAGAAGVQNYEAEGGVLTKIAPPAKAAAAGQ